jgi:hypothetical protein
MCLSKPSLPAPPPPMQASQAPDSAPLKKRKPQGMGTGGTLLTGPSGVSMATTATGATTLLGQ